jgi:beta-lactamase superfamily II metal-dependent hydrolase
MFDVGFGDAFLVEFPGPDTRRLKVLIDCGSIKKGKGGSIRSVAGRIAEEANHQIDVVVATHRHRDHVSGFSSPLWSKVQVKEVWMPWTEHETDPEARRIRDLQSSLALALQDSDAQFGAGSRVRDMAENSLANAAAMKTLHEGFLGNPKRLFLPVPGGRTVGTSVLPGIKVHALGPSRDVEVIRDMEPSGGEAYLNHLDALRGRTSGALKPFEEKWSLEHKPFAQLFRHLSLSRSERASVSAADAGTDQAIAVALEKAVNGTSLMLLFEVGETRLLFPGDAQMGTWKQVLGDPDWRKLLNGVCFYKVGHHGSHNATPKEFVERVIGQDFYAMASTCKIKKWPDIPKEALLEALDKRSKRRSRVIRSDHSGQLAESSTISRGSGFVQLKIPIVDR